MCFVLAWKTGLWAKAIDLWLSPLSGMVMLVAGSSFPPQALSGSRSWWIAWAHVFCLDILMSACYLSGCRRLSLVRKSRNHVTSLAANVRAIYSAFVDDSATVDCLFEHQLTGPLFSMNIKPDVDFWLSLSPAQSESEYPWTQSSFSPPYVIPWSRKPLRYQKIFLTALVCWWEGFFAKRLATDIA